MPSRESFDAETRQRIRAWLWHFKTRRGWSVTRLARELGMTDPTISNVLKGRRSAGLDLLIAMHRKFQISADDVLDTTPGDAGAWSPSRCA